MVEKKKKHNGLVVFVIVLCFVVAGCLIGYYKMMKRQQQTEESTPTTEAEKLIAKDLESDYPETPKEVMKLWGRINQCLYNTTLEDDQFTSLLGQLRVLYSSELLEENTEENHRKKLKEEIEEFRGDKGKIVSYSAETGKTVQYKKVNGKQCADIQISYFINQKSGYSKLYEDFVLVKEDGKWKVLGFKESGSSSANDESTSDK